LSVERPFCADPDAAARFDRWLALIETPEIEATFQDRYVLGLLASRESALETLRARIASDPEPSLSLLDAEQKAARSFRESLVWMSALMGHRISEPDMAETVATAPRATAPNVLQMPLRVSDDVQGRILAALEGTNGMDKGALSDRVKAAPQAFRDALRALVALGRVRRSGLGRKGKPFTYSIGSDRRSA
jgi:hypothetical protein